MVNPAFLGRQHEFRQLTDLYKRDDASLVTVKGRRRVGKSRLIMEFAKNKTFYQFTGLPPTPETTAQSQRDEFARQLGEQFGLPGIQAQDWGDLFTLLARHTQKGRVVILIDEISWMGNEDPDFLGKLKVVWDIHFKQNRKLIMVLCSSISTWMEKNILASTGFFGRIALNLSLHELSLAESNQFLSAGGFRGSVYERLMLLAVAGGIPWYLELMNSARSAIDTIQQLCFSPDGILVNEFNYIFHDLFARRGPICKKIVDFLAQGPADYSTIANALDYPSGGPLSEYLNDLVTCGFLKHDNTWDIKAGDFSKLSKYRLSDNYLRFYIKYIEPNLIKIKQGRFLQTSMSSLPNWDGILGLQLENLVLNNREIIWQALGISADDIVIDNPYFQRKTKRYAGCQVDYLIQTKYNSLYICEVKFSKHKISKKVIEQVTEKIQRLQSPKGYACQPVLIHAGCDVSVVEDADYFNHIVDLADSISVD